jgi:hypothetical protein
VPMGTNLKIQRACQLTDLDRNRLHPGNLNAQHQDFRRCQPSYYGH